MATIGAFTQTDDGYRGAVRTPVLNVKVRFVPADKDSDKAPDFRIFSATTEFGAAWKRTSQAGRDYLSVKLDDPTFPAPIHANLVEGEAEGEHILVWSRS
jgi:uncharacterized protein (DUF736 family)